ncbi:copper chaperone PCu(A)C [Algimonas porphyrae]|uniref:Copper chaperone PCu(A)C n=1 Tax=Algimonas porphyrae TaxID=1128113 RepID=A0ABQ5V1S7_9PROT|nr:copper chaperone PCu(A)C [Algimonas porphyrae]GLQ20639.1 hypothetical protein GCM10007854_15940 [Algimonas porphyrae]
MTRLLLVTTAALIVAACSDAKTALPDDATPDATITASASSAVTISDAYMLPPLIGRNVGAAFFVATNDGVTDARIISASSPVADTVELHTHTMTDGVMAMREVDGIDIPAGGSVVLEPGSLHLMMFGMAVAEGQTDAPVTLTYADGETVTLIVPVRSR